MFVSAKSRRMAFPVALVVHVPLILLETFALLWNAWQAPFFTKRATAR